MKIAVVGATGLVGSLMLKILEERNFPLTQLVPAASKRSVGKSVQFRGKEYKVVSLDEAVSNKPDIALFSAGGDVSKEWAARFADAGAVVIDNSSAWRMDPDKKLIVPEVNGHLLNNEDKIIANPNCSTIQMVVAIHPLHKRFRINRIVVSTYQAVGGSGYKALRQMEQERKGEDVQMIYPHPIDKNCIPQAGDFLENGYTTEEEKLLNETHKILGDNSIRITATAVRIPVEVGHAESINLEFGEDFNVAEVREILQNSPGVKVADDTSSNIYPMPLHAAGTDDVYVGRIRRDHSQPNSLNLWVVSDNLRKGAATNAVQIAEMVRQFKVKG